MTGPAVRTPVTRAAASMPLPVDRHLIEAGTFGLIQQYGVGLELIDVDAAKLEYFTLSRPKAARVASMFR